MPLRRVTFKGPIFGRKQESELEWREKSHAGEIPLATVNMEIFGEIEPLAVADNSSLCDLQSNQSCIYEYMWNIGLTGTELNWLEKCDADDTLLVQVIVQGGKSRFISREIFATLEYLPPSQNIIESPNILKKIFSGVGNVAKDTGFKTVGSLSAFVSDLIPAQNEQGSKWYLNKFDYPTGSSENQCAYGVEWHISKKIIYEVGSRLVGRIGILFIDAPICDENSATFDDKMYLFGKFGLKLANEKGDWFGFGMLPKKDSNVLRLSISPKGIS